MRHTLPILLLLVAVAFAMSLRHVTQSGDELRRDEQAAQGHLAELMRAQERWRSREDRDPGSPPYTSLSTLIAAGELPGFAMAPELDRDSDRVEVARAGDYYFELSLRAGASQAGRAPQMGGRYQVWAWPALEGHHSSLLFWGSNAGYLVQGENGQVAGVSSPPYGTHPLREVSELDEKFAAGEWAPRRWIVLENVRGGSEVADADPQ